MAIARGDPLWGPLHLPDHPKRQEIYPDSVDSDDVIAFTYNRQQQVTSITDQNGTVHSYDYDKLGRQTQDRITTVGTDVDDAVLRRTSVPPDPPPSAWVGRRSKS